MTVPWPSFLRPLSVPSCLGQSGREDAFMKAFPVWLKSVCVRLVLVVRRGDPLGGRAHSAQPCSGVEREENAGFIPPRLPSG